MTSISEVTFCVKTFERPDALMTLQHSIRKYYPDNPIIIADDSEKPLHPDYFDSNTHIHAMPYDSGLSAGRNEVIAMAKTPYIVLLDDDFRFTPATQIWKWLPWIESGIFDIMGGGLRLNGKRVTHFEGSLELAGTVLKCGHSTQGINPMRCDCILNFFCADRVNILNVGWDEELKLGEHLDFFMRCQQAGLSVGYHPEVQADHVPMKSKAYNSIRYPKAAFFREKFREKWNIHQIAGLHF